MSKFGVTLGPSPRAEPLPAGGEARPSGGQAWGAGREAGTSLGGAPLARGVSVGGVIAGKYRVERVIGHGGMGVVVAATQLALQRTVAIKLIRGDWADDPLAVERLVREARALASIQSQHVARVLDVGTLDDGIPFIVMEYLEGHDLDTLLRREGPLPVSEAVDYLLQACEALAEAHRNGLVHRDIKPANLFVARQPSGADCIKVVDFGISKLINSASVESLTHPSRIVGSLYHMAPEQLSGDPVDARTDVWALGVLLFELLTGRKPFQGGAWPAVCARVLSDTEPPESLGAHVPGELQSAVRRCLQRLPEERFSNVAELAVALSPFGTRSARSSLEQIVRLATSTGSLAAESHSPLPPGLGSPARGGGARVSGAGGLDGATPAPAEAARRERDTAPPPLRAASALPGRVPLRTADGRRAQGDDAQERGARGRGADVGGAHGRGAERRVAQRHGVQRHGVQWHGVQWLVVGVAALLVVSVPWLVTRLLRPVATAARPAELPPPRDGVVERRAAERAAAQRVAAEREAARRTAAEREAAEREAAERVPPGRPALEVAVPALSPGAAPRGAAASSGRILEPAAAELEPSPPTIQPVAEPSSAAPRVRVLSASELEAAPPRAAVESAPPAAKAASGPPAAAAEQAPAQGRLQSSPRGADPWDFRDLEFE